MKISEEKQERIKEGILSILYQHAPKPLFTAEVSHLAVRDEEFIKRLLLELKEKKLVVEMKKNAKGETYTRRSRWILSEKTYAAYNALQHNSNESTI